MKKPLTIFGIRLFRKLYEDKTKTIKTCPICELIYSANHVSIDKE